MECYLNVFVWEGVFLEAAVLAVSGRNKVPKGEMLKTRTKSLPETGKPCLRFIPVATGLVCVPRDPNTIKYYFSGAAVMLPISHSQLMAV